MGLPILHKYRPTCFYQLRRLRQLRRLIGKEATAQLVSALILSRLDYCNALLAGLPCSMIQRLQRVENAAARLVCRSSQGYLYKLCLLMHNIHTGRAPQYLVDCVSPMASSSSLRLGLRSPNTAKYVKHTAQTKLGERAFSYAGPAAWSALPASLHGSTDTSKFF